MENITYDLIIKYLKTDNMISDKKTFNYNLKFNNLFPKTFFRYGITKHDKDNFNISFWTSLLTLYDENFMVPFDQEELTIIENFKKDILDKYSKSKLSNITKKLTKNDLRQIFKLDPGIEMLQYIVEILDVNIFIFNINNNIESIDVLYNTTFLNFNKNTLLFFKFDNYWEPIMENINNELIKIFTKEHKIIDIINNNLQLLKYLNNSKEINIDQIIKNVNNKYNKTFLNKLKMAEIHDIIKELEIDIKDIKPLKNNLIKLILKNN